jgi:putative membrane protein
MIRRAMFRRVRQTEKRSEADLKGIVIRWLILAAAIMVASSVLAGIEVKGFFPALGAAAMLGMLNAVLRPVLLILTLPINILSLGLFTFVINALLLKIASAVIPGFDVHGFWTALFGSLIITSVSWLLNAFINERGRVQCIDLKKKGGDRWE